MTMLARVVISFICAILIHLNGQQRRGIPLPPPGHNSLRNEVREMIRPQCGSCHTSTLPTAKQKAVAVFDLAKEDWPTTISEKRFEAFKRRLSSLDNSQKEKVDRFVQEEINHRAPAGSKE